MIEFDKYDYKEHLHRYGIWTAARAQRAFMTTAQIKTSLNEVNIKEKAFCLDMNMDADTFDKWHLEICNHLKEVLCQKKIADIKFGRAAKIINVYLKTTIIIPNCNTDRALINSIHPPINRILLNCLVKEGFLSKEYFTSWTTMEEDTYSKIITEFRRKKGFDPLWKIEACWHPENDKETNVKPIYS